MKSVEEIKTLFLAKGLNITLQRIAVYQAMEVLEHACPEEVMFEVRKKYPTITVGTIYNVLESFAQNNILSKLMTADSKMYFDINIHDHHHLYSLKDKKIMDFEDDELTLIIQNYLKSKKFDHFNIEKIKIYLIGNCI